ncbi:PhoH family protein [Corynebacterium striatum]|uniref:PhoH family protein n=1 Tax=Corynebacterium TaxID=1716 RepID=UPI000665A3FF|nr:MULTISPECIES: PhoH family protein [Corynebacterium]EGT5594023.1 PhoH family protein [Corynebacterium striatum]KAA1262956.1 PhoH family protein [Corynebacterium striatum]MDK8876539.1 PhoH family protein [Corynebacterium striatum]MDK8881008.1 PhoH family protein [Corynebacterium striatum]OFT62900.1 phosphate starvation-inducible protein PhoH [Corynebacterium sp. HMSC05D08]
MPIITKKFELDSAYVATVLGSADDNLRVLNNLLDADLFARGTTVTVTGPDYEVARAAKVLEELEAIARRGHSVSTDTVKHTVDMVAVDAPQSVSAALAADIVKRRGKSVRPKTVGQSEYVQAIDDNTVVFGIGPAGSGKTYLAVAKAVQALQTKQVSRIILTRPAVEAGEKLGFLPGTLNDKIDPYLRPLYDALRDMLDPEMIPKLMEAGIIEVAPLAYMRGRTLNDAFVILDEAQNTTPAQMKMFLTRLGFGSKIVVTGDISQVDLPRGQISGLRLVRRILEGVPDIHFADLGSGDVVRHQLVSRIVNAYDAAEAKSAAKNAASKYVEEGE